MDKRRKREDKENYKLFTINDGELCYFVAAENSEQAVDTVAQFERTNGVDVFEECEWNIRPPTVKKISDEEAVILKVEYHCSKCGNDVFVGLNKLFEDFKKGKFVSVCDGFGILSFCEV